LRGVDTLTNANVGIYDVNTHLPRVALSSLPTFEFTAGIP
jgi:hypothetical protein